MNTETPRIFVAATQQNDGKTTVALGLFAALRQRLGRIGFIKPVGQRFMRIDGKEIDEDTFLIDNTFKVNTPLEAMSPIAVEPNFTRRYIEEANNEFLVRRIQNSFDRAAWEKDFLIVEGTGHAGVGSVFDLSNAKIARMLGCKVILVTVGGIGRPIDELVLNRALFEKEGVEVAGAILNKVIATRRDYICGFASRGLSRQGIDLLGCVPVEPVLARPTLQQICERVQGQFLCCRQAGLRRVDRVIIGAMTSPNILGELQEGTLIITPGDREDVVLAALSTASLTDPALPNVAGIVLSGDMKPHENVLKLLQQSSLPAIHCHYDSYTVASMVHSMTIKTTPGDAEKITKIQSLVERYVDIERLIEKVRA